MRRKTVLGIMLTLLLTGMSTLISNIQPVKGEPSTWTVDDDGPADFAAIQEAINSPQVMDGDTIYVYNGTYYENVVMNKTLSLIGENRSTTIINGNGTRTVVRGEASNVSICDFTIKNGTHAGIDLTFTNNNTIKDNLITSNKYGVFMSKARLQKIIGNNLTNNMYGMLIRESQEVTLRKNNITGNKFNFGVCGSAYSLSDFIHDIDTSNMVEEKPIFYLINQNDLVIDPVEYPEIGYLALVNSTNVTVKDVLLTDNIQGLLLAHTNDSVVQNITASRNDLGIGLVRSDRNKIDRNIISQNYGERGMFFGGIGIGLGHSDNTTIASNTITNNTYGISTNPYYSYIIYGSSDCNISRNIITSNKYGIYLSNTHNFTMRANDMTNNTYNFHVLGSEISDYIHDIDTSNTMNDKPMYYWVEQHDKQIPSDAGYVAIVSSTNITAKALKVTNSGEGIFLVDTKNSTITNNNITSNYHGIELFRSSNNTLRDNNLTNNFIGLKLTNSSGNELTGNKLINNDRGIELFLASNNTLEGNNITNSDRGLRLDRSTYNTISGNNITNSEWYGINLISSSNNKVYHNNLINNAEKPYLYDSYNNVWDNGYPSGGNYWSDYTGQDSDGDGIGDTPYVIDASNRDNYPFMNPWTPEAHDVATVNVTPSKTVVGQDYALHVNVTVTNQGSYTQTFNVTAYANTTVIETEIVTLESGNTTIITFTWNTTGFAYGNYEISAVADVVPGETDTDDNTHIDGKVLVTIPGDVNGDRTVNVLDVGTISDHWYPGPPIGPLGYGSNADVNNDGNVNIVDVAVVSAHWEQTW